MFRVDGEMFFLCQRYLRTPEDTPRASSSKEQTKLKSESPEKSEMKASLRGQYKPHVPQFNRFWLHGKVLRKEITSS